MMKNVIEIENLVKTYGAIKAVDNLSFHVKEGELFAFLGVNGAGKSTTISIICGALEKNSGKVIIDGNDIDKDMHEIKAKLGVVFQNSVLDSLLSVRDNLFSRASLYGMTSKEASKRINELAETFDFKNLLNRQVGKLSGGQRRRIDVARALIHKPKILILDEPTTGLDPQTRKLLWDTIENIRKNEGMTVFLTTHYMEEATDADYVVILDTGKIVANGTPLDLKNRYTGDYITIYHVELSDIERLQRPFELVNDGYRVEVKDTLEARNLILEYPEIFKDFEITKGKMDDVFLAVTGKKLVGGNI